jgi:hypothetical protein
METSKYRFLVDRKEIHYIRTTLESYDGMAVVRTLDPKRAVIEVMTAPACDDMVLDLLHHLVEKEHMEIKTLRYG